MSEETNGEVDWGEVGTLFGIVKSCTEHAAFTNINSRAMTRLKQIDADIAEGKYDQEEPNG